MRGIILAGGTGSRLGDLTKVVNKHLLPVGGYPMIHWPLKVLHDNGVTDITIVSTQRGVGQLAELLGAGYHYCVQHCPGGVPHALHCARRGIELESIAVILGDNVFVESPPIPRRKTRSGATFAHVFLKEVAKDKLCEFGVPYFDSDGEVYRVIEKPEEPPSSYAVIGLYVFSGDVFDRITTLHPSKRNELEIADLINTYGEQNALDHSIINGFWGDAGTLRGMMECEVGIRAVSQEEQK